MTAAELLIECPTLQPLYPLGCQVRVDGYVGVVPLDSTRGRLRPITAARLNASGMSIEYFVGPGRPDCGDDRRLAWGWVEELEVVGAGYDAGE